MRIFATGSNGYIGKALVCAGVFPLISDVTNPVEVENEIKAKRPDLILHLAAKSKPEFCEKLENRNCVVETNVRGFYNVVNSASRLGASVVLFSSGQVWRGGFWEKPHRENDKETPPVNMYGMTKLAAEALANMCNNAKIVRMSSVFDAKCLAPKIDALERGWEIVEPTFIRRSFIYLEDFVSLVLQYGERFPSMPKALHLAGNETVSWYDFMHEVAEQYGFDPSLVKPRRKDSKEFAPRPHNAGLNTDLARSLGFRIPNYVDGIKRMKENQNG